MTRGHVRVQGVVGSTADASLVRDQMAERPCVSEPKIGKVTQVVNGTRQKYVLEYDVKCPGEPGTKKKSAEKAGGETKPEPEEKEAP
jgi:hypothetical protein